MSLPRIRSGTHQGSKHLQLKINNQDSRLVESFSIPTWKKEYAVGFISDGCTGVPAFSRTEVGAHLIPLYAFVRIQELLCSGIVLDQIPRVLFPMVTEFIRDLANKIMPSTAVWQYPMVFKGKLLEERNSWTTTTRFRMDYLAASLLGFITDGESLVTFSGGDGIILVNDTLNVIDQNDQPDYPAISINNPGKNFATQSYKLSDVRRLVLATDGLKCLMSEPVFVERMFSHMPEHGSGLDCLLNVTFNERPQDMQDDCTAVTLQV